MQSAVQKLVQRQQVREESEDDEKKWDCETIQTTLTNTDNHPGVIKTVRKVVKPKNKIELHK